MQNFLPLSREIQSHWVYKDNDCFKVWIEILFNARFSKTSKSDVYKGALYTINYGEFLYSRPSYSKRLNIPENKLRTFIDNLIKDNMIEKVASIGKNKATIYRVINYEKYNFQPSETIDTTSLEAKTNQLTTNWPPTDHQLTTTKEERKKDKKENIPYQSIVEYLNKVANTSYKYSTNKTKDCITARFNEGFTEENFKTVIDKKHEQWKGTEFEKFLRPETLFGNKFDGYLNEKISKADKKETQFKRPDSNVVVAPREFYIANK